MLYGAIFGGQRHRGMMSSSKCEGMYGTKDSSLARTYSSMEDARSHAKFCAKVRPDLTFIVLATRYRSKTIIRIRVTQRGEFYGYVL